MAELTRSQVTEKFAQVERIINATTQRPTIVNSNSRFVVVTYWWGRDRLNFNTSRPCGDFYESLLDKPIHLLASSTATDTRFRAALLRNSSFTRFIDKKLADYHGVVEAYKAEGHSLSALYKEQDTDQRKNAVLEIVLSYVQTVLPDIRAFQQLYLERAELEDTFKRRIAAGLTTAAQLTTIRSRLMELKQGKETMLKQMKSKAAPFKSALDGLLRYSDPITYDAMIANWEATCAKAGCNYLAVEYPEFAAPGGYQLAINAKPRFIQKALELCKGYGVLYIDGDMTVNHYPAIFDTPDVDMMARGWNVDPRSSYLHNESILVDPYSFETSGGTMFFGATPEAALLLRRWIEVSEQYSQWGKADDRILSLVFNTHKLLLPLKVIQLPVEYLWLSLDYDSSIEPELQDNSAIFLEHPECLTSEETAAGQGASSSRTPKFYTTVEDAYPRSEFLHEAVLFPSEDATTAFRPYLNYLRGARYFEDVEDESLVDTAPFRVVPFAAGLGPYQAAADANARAISLLPSLPSKNENGTLVFSETDATIPRILQALQAGYNVRYIPTTASRVYKDSLETTLARFPRIEFAFVNKSPDRRNIFFFNSMFDVQEPAFFRAGAPHLQQLLSACGTLSDLATLYKDNYQFLSRIRTHFLKKYKQQGGGAAENQTQESENALEFLYGRGISGRGISGGKRSKRRTNRRITRRRIGRKKSTQTRRRN